MGDGGNETQTQTSSSNSFTGANPAISGNLESLGNSFWDYYNSNGGAAPAYYPYSTVQPMSQTTNDALGTIAYRGQHGDPTVQGLNANAAGQVNKTLNGDYLDINNNPYFQGALKAGFAPQTELLNEVTIPNLRSQFAGAGRTSYTPQGADFETTNRAVNDLSRSQANSAAQASLGAYTAERGNQMNAVNQAGQLGNTIQGQQYQDLQAMLGAGQAYDAYGQRVTDANVDRYNYNNTAQPEYFARMAQLLQSIVPGGSTSSSGTQTGTTSGGGGGFGSILGGGLGLAGLGLQAYTAFSDERLKDVDGRVGQTDDGLPLYLYKYKGDDQPRIGPMAQDVAQVNPDAVVEHPSGYLMVDYSQLMPEGGLL